jgi:hypothetical protein
MATECCPNCNHGVEFNCAHCDEEWLGPYTDCTVASNVTHQWERNHVPDLTVNNYYIMFYILEIFTPFSFPDDLLFPLPHSSFCSTHLMFVNEKTRGAAISCSPYHPYKTTYLSGGSNCGTYSSTTYHYWDTPS